MGLPRVFDWKIPLEPLESLVGEQISSSRKGAQSKMRIVAVFLESKKWVSAASWTPSHPNNSTASKPIPIL